MCKNIATKVVKNRVARSIKKKRRKAAFRCVGALLLFLCGFLAGVHRRVVFAKLTGKPMPEAPAWHKWCHPG